MTKVTGADPALMASPPSQSALSRPIGFDQGEGWTPAPWYAAQPYKDGPFTIYDGRNRSLATVWPESLLGEPLNEVANASVMSAAPELYDALRELMACWPEGSIPNGPVCVKASRAMAKARGEI